MKEVENCWTRVMAGCKEHVKGFCVCVSRAEAADNLTDNLPLLYQSELGFSVLLPLLPFSWTSSLDGDFLILKQDPWEEEWWRGLCRAKPLSGKEGGDWWMCRTTLLTSKLHPLPAPLKSGQRFWPTELKNPLFCVLDSQLLVVAQWQSSSSPWFSIGNLLLKRNLWY